MNGEYGCEREHQPPIGPRVITDAHRPSRGSAEASPLRSAQVRGGQRKPLNLLRDPDPARICDYPVGVDVYETGGVNRRRSSQFFCFYPRTNVMSSSCIRNDEKGDRYPPRPKRRRHSGGGSVDLATGSSFAKATPCPTVTQGSGPPLKDPSSPRRLPRLIAMRGTKGGSACRNSPSSS